MTKVEIDGKTYCVETLIYTIERLTKDVKASAEYYRLMLEQIRAEIEQITDTMGVSYNQYVSKIDVLQIIDKYKAEREE